MTAIDFIRGYFSKEYAPISSAMLVLVANTRHGLMPTEVRTAIAQLEQEGYIKLNERARLCLK